jgi:hypothetical protein
MRKFIVSVALATATLAAVPAAAQPNQTGWDQRGDHRGDRGDYDRRGPGRAAINDLLGDLSRAENQIARAQRFRAISPREAISLRREATQIRFRLNGSFRGGISNREFGELRLRVNRLEQRVRIERRDRDRHPG